MQSTRLSVARDPFLHALKTLAAARRRRFSSSLPIWLSFEKGGDELHITEDRAKVAARVPASGSWSPAGATVDLFMLRRAVARVEAENVDLHVLADAVVIHGDRWQVRLNLLTFGPESRRPKRGNASVAEG